MRLARVPGVFVPRSDTWLLAAHARRQPQVKGAALDVCTGSGAVAVAAARAGATSVTAVDVSRRALISTRLNARLNGVTVRTRRGNLLDAVAGEQFDLNLSNPPYLPCLGRPHPRGRSRHVDGGPDGRRVIEQAPGTSGPADCSY
jgi:release factor glutamine methyltransferase